MTLTDKQVTAPVVKDDEFVAFVRSVLTCLNEKMDSFITNQADLERQLKATDERVTAQVTVIKNISETVNFNANNINRQQQSIDAMERTLAKATRDAQNATASIAKLEDRLNHAERHSRGFNIRVLGAREVVGEDCVNIVENILKEKFALVENVIENAHRIEK